MEIKGSAKTFAYAIESTKEFNDLIQAKRVIQKKALLKKEVIDFNEKLANIYSSNKDQVAIKYDVEQLFKKFGTLSQNVEIKKFLKSSDAFSQLMYKTQQYITELIQKEIAIE